MAKMEGTYIQVAYKNVFGYISTNSWPFFMIQRPTIREKCAWVRSNTWQDERPVATGLDRFFSVFRFFDKHRNWQPKKCRIWATATGGLVFCGWVQSDFGLFSSPANWTCEHYEPGEVVVGVGGGWGGKGGGGKTQDNDVATKPTLFGHLFGTWREGWYMGCEN